MILASRLAPVAWRAQQVLVDGDRLLRQQARLNHRAGFGSTSLTRERR
jgi:hypothetical protein